MRGARYSLAVCSAAARFIRVFHPTGRIPSPADRGCRTERVRAAPGQSIRRALVDGPAGSPILIHSITADNDRLNGPPSLDELRCAPAASRTPGILLWPRTSPSNLIQAGLERARCCRRLWCGSPLCRSRSGKNGGIASLFSSKFCEMIGRRTFCTDTNYHGYGIFFFLIHRARRGWTFEKKKRGKGK